MFIFQVLKWLHTYKYNMKGHTKNTFSKRLFDVVIKYINNNNNNTKYGWITQIVNRGEVVYVIMY